MARSPISPPSAPLGPSPSGCPTAGSSPAVRTSVYVNTADQCHPITPAPQFLFEFVQKPIFAVLSDGINIHLVHSRCPFVGLYPSPGLFQDVPSTDLVVEKCEPPFRLLLGHSV